MRDHQRTHRDIAADMEFACALADVADQFTWPRFQQADFTTGWKDDRTEVTEVDRQAESLLAQQVISARPDDGFFGEEHGAAGRHGSHWQWIVDPIDGTSGFVRGMPIWATLIALTYHPRNGPVEVVVGVVSAPALGRRWWAGAELGSFVATPASPNSKLVSDFVRRNQVSDVADLADAQVNVTLNDGWDRLGCTPALTALMLLARRTRGVGDFWQHCLVAEGALDVAVDAIGVAPYDLAAVSLIVTEAGGKFTDRHGTSTHLSDSAISTNGVLHDTVLRRLSVSG